MVFPGFPMVFLWFSRGFFTLNRPRHAAKASAPPSDAADREAVVAKMNTGTRDGQRTRYEVMVLSHECGIIMNWDRVKTYYYQF